MKKIKKTSIVAVSLILVIVCVFSCFLSTSINVKQTQQATSVTRTIEAEQNAMDFQSVFSQFESATLTTENNVTTFEGYKTFDLLDFSEIDLVSESDIDANTKIQVKYHYNYDYTTNVNTLTATLIDEEGNTNIDTMSGVTFVNKKEKKDRIKIYLNEINI